MEETITLNIWQRMNWVDETLNWDAVSNLTVITLILRIWTPDLELLNVANAYQFTLLNLVYTYQMTGPLLIVNPPPNFMPGPIIEFLIFKLVV